MRNRIHWIEYVLLAVATGLFFLALHTATEGQKQYAERHQISLTD